MSTAFLTDEQYDSYIKEEIQRIANEYPNMFMTREEILNKMNIPKNTSRLVIVKSNNYGTGFLRNQYDK